MRQSLRSGVCTGTPNNKPSLIAGGIGASLAMACLTTGAAAQDADLIILPTGRCRNNRGKAPGASGRQTAPRGTAPCGDTHGLHPRIGWHSRFAPNRKPRSGPGLKRRNVAVGAGPRGRRREGRSRRQQLR